MSRRSYESVPLRATASAHPNLAFVKYWGNRDEDLRLPANGSISMTLGALWTRMAVWFEPRLSADAATVNGRSLSGAALERVARLLARVRDLAGVQAYAAVESVSNFRTDNGLASSAAAFAALSLAATTALGLELSERELSCLARLGSGSAARSVPGGFVEWHAGVSHETSFAETFAPPSHWDLVDLVAVVDRSPKKVGSTEGHALAPSSVLQEARVASADSRLSACRDAVMHRDFAALAEVVELDSNLMHAVMMTSNPPLFYWRPSTLAVMGAVRRWRAEGAEVLYTVDAGANVHSVCAPGHADEVHTLLGQRPEVVEVIRSEVGGPVVLHDLA